MTEISLIALIALFGALGAVSRYAVGIWSTQLLGSQFPFGTLLVNVLGCLAIGIVIPVGEKVRLLHPHLFSASAVGFLGAFTTFSAFGYQTMHLLENYSFWSALGNVTANVVLGLLAVWGGIALARTFVGSG